MKRVVLTLVFILTFAGNSKAIDKTSLDKYFNSVDGVILSSPNLILSFRVIRVHLQGMDRNECTGVVSLYRNHFKGIVDYLNTITPPTYAQSTHHFLVGSWSKQLEATEHMLKYCDTHDTTQITKAIQAIEESDRLIDKAAMEMEKLMLIESEE